MAARTDCPRPSQGSGSAEGRAPEWPGCKARPGLGRGTQRLHTSLILFTNLASFGESVKTRGVSRFSRPFTRLQLWNETLFGRSLYSFRPQIFACSRVSAPSAQLGGWRLQICDLQGELQAAGLPTRRSSGTPDQSSGRGRALCKHSTNGASSVRSFATEARLPIPSAGSGSGTPHTCGPSTSWRKCQSFLPLRLATVPSQPYLSRWWGSLGHPMALALRSG